MSLSAVPGGLCLLFGALFILHRCLLKPYYVQLIHSDLGQNSYYLRVFPFHVFTVFFLYSARSCWQTNLGWFGFGFFPPSTNESPEGCHTLVIGRCSFDGLCVSFQWSLCFLSISTKTLVYSWMYCTSSQCRLLGGGGLSSMKLVHMSPMFIWQGANMLCQKM